MKFIRKKNYEGVNLFNGKTMSCEVNNTSDVVSIQLFVVNEEGEPVKEIEEKGEEKIIKHRIVFDCSGHGTTPKVQYVAPGDYVFEPLMMNDSGFEFKGWYTLTKDKIKSVKANNKNVTVKTKGKALQITGKKSKKITVKVTE